MSNWKSLPVSLPSASMGGNLRLFIDGGGNITLTSETGDKTLQQWSADTANPQIEASMTDGKAILVGSRRFVISPAVRQAEIDDWLSLARITSPAWDVASEPVDQGDLSEKLLRLRTLLDQGHISRDEFNTLAGQAALDASTSGQATSPNPGSPTKLPIDSLQAELQDALMLAQGRGSRNAIVRETDVFEVLHRAKIEFEHARRNPALIMSMYKAHQIERGAGLSLILQVHKVEAKVKKALATRRPLPPDVQQAFDRWEYNYRMRHRPLYLAAEKMGWKNLPVF